jgi:two-component system alkaline phosphatase synthesis response regulator PhoP
MQSALECQPDVVVLDIMMKGMDGFQVCKWLRVKSILRRQELMRTQQRNQQQLLTWGDFELDLLSMRCRLNGEPVELTPKEFILLKILMQHPDKPFTRDELLDLAWGKDYFGDNKIVDVNIRRLRE